jgi:hypothetical protein
LFSGASKLRTKSVVDTSAIPALRRLRQEDGDFQAHMDYITVFVSKNPRPK